MDLKRIFYGFHIKSSFPYMVINDLLCGMQVSIDPPGGAAAAGKRPRPPAMLRMEEGEANDEAREEGGAYE